MLFIVVFQTPAAGQEINLALPFFCLIMSDGQSIGHKNKPIMPRYIITTKRLKSCNGVRVEPGMQVEVVTSSFSNPVSTNGGQIVADAFMRIYGIDIKKAGCLNLADLDVKRM